MEKILLELILNNQCNKRCEYCDLDFKTKSLSFGDLDKIYDFLSKNDGFYTINFFGGEPLLSFDKLKYFLDKNNNVIKKFSLGTNGVLLNEEKLEYFRKNNVTIYLSIDNIDSGNDLNFELISKYSDIININFINDPDYLGNSISIFKKIINYGFKNISFMPVFNTKKWSKESLLFLKKIYLNILNLSGSINLSTFTYFNGVSIDKQFILDTDMNLYSDLDSLLWLQKQYKNIDISLLKKINSKTNIYNLYSEDISLQNILKKYNIKDILELVFEIPKKSGDLITYKIIDKILESGTKKG